MRRAIRARRPKGYGPPQGLPWIWLTREMLESPAYRCLGINARRLLDFLMIEHMHHAGTENGRLVAPYNQLVSFGIAKSEISSAIEGLASYGWIELQKGMRLGGRTHPSLYALTWLPKSDGSPPTNLWKRTTEAHVKNYRLERRRTKGLRQRFKDAAALRDTLPTIR